MNISIERVLAQIKSGNEGVFTIGFVRASGKSQGSIKTVKALYGAPKPNGDKAGISPRKVHIHKEAGTLPLTDHDTGEYITPLISHIILFNNCKVYH